MRIAVVSNTAWYLFNFRLNLMRALQADGHAVTAVAPADAYADKIRAAGIAFEGVPISGRGINPLVEMRSVLRLWALLRRRRPGGRIGLVLSYTPKGNLYSALACLAARVPFIANVSGLGRTSIRHSFVSRVVETLYRVTLRRAHRVFFQNEDDLGSFVQKDLVRADHAERLPGSGVDLVRFQPGAAGKVPAPAADAPIFLLMARLMWDKGVGEYVAAARVVKARHPRARFLLLGFLDVANPSAISRRQMDAWTAEGLVDYQGPTDDVRPWLAQADCVVLPSYREGVPRTLLEAAAMARPIVTTDAPGCRDTVIDGETGFLCRTADAQDLADKLLRFTALPLNEREAMGRRGREFVTRNFDERFVLRRYQAVVKDLCAVRERSDTSFPPAPPDSDS